jgi:Family of unknown function (DUF6200)
MTAALDVPIILDLGKASRKRVRQLKRGQGRLLEDVQDALTEVTATLGEQAEGKQIVPVVLMYRKRSRRKARGGGIVPIPFCS